MAKTVPNTQTGSLTGHQYGTNDILFGVEDEINLLYGDAFDMYDRARGGGDTLIGGDGRVFNFLFGDASEMHNNTRGGDDHLTGGNPSFNDLTGDARIMDGHSRGGDDTLMGGDGVDGVFSSNLLVGDAREMHHNTRGGDDHMTGGNESGNALFGDSQFMYDRARGGNDTLIAGDTSSPFIQNYLTGDGSFMFDNARGGDDTLVSGTGSEIMWGDGQWINGLEGSPTNTTGAVVTGADTFVFAPGSGTDFIYDFRQADRDRIDVSAYGIDSLDDLVIASDGVSTTIAFDATNGVTLNNFSDFATLHVSDFIFA